jgi:FKBP-type peptidyl-prolyl cis-trans isomerase FklB
MMERFKISVTAGGEVAPEIFRSWKGVCMKFRWAVAAAAILLLTAQAGAEEKMTLKTQKEKLSYTMGVETARGTKKQSVDIDPDLLYRGLKDAMSGSALLMTDEEMGAVMNTFRQEITAKQAAEAKMLVEKNKKEGEAFLAENGKKEGVKTLPSGLQYKVLVEGTGKSPGATDTVTAHYRGTFIDGTEFDSSYKRDNKPATFRVNGVIAGWTEALQLMKEGARWRIFIPSALAYGESGAGGVIGPNATLIFEIELISVK